MNQAIIVDNLTKDFGGGRGVFNISFTVGAGECLGFLGPNGAGKTTAIRALMGFLHPDYGQTKICGRDTWKYRADLMDLVGYLPGEITVPENMTGSAFLSYLEGLRHTKASRKLELIERFNFDAHNSIRSMGIGEKRKLAVIAAFMHDPQILVLDEPTSGLDPVMQDEFVRFLLEEKAQGKTVLLSSHLFNEVIETCDQIAIIKAGHIVDRFENKASAKNSSVYTGSVLVDILRGQTRALSGFQKQTPFQKGAAITLKGATKNYGNNKGIFDLNLSVARGESVGLVGTNGSGKTTTLRTLMGFTRLDSGEACLFEKDAWENHSDLMRHVSYVPGDITFPRFASAHAFFEHQQKLWGQKGNARTQELLDSFKLDASVDSKKMSKGMKQKTALVAAFMANRDILIMDEPTTGLDPVMRDVFIDLINQERKRGKTILMSSHVLEEVIETCDRVAVIHEGKIVGVFDVEQIRRLLKTNDEVKALEDRFRCVFEEDS